MKYSLPPLTLNNQPEFYSGHMFGFDQPCMVFKLRFNVAIEQFHLDCSGLLLAVDQTLRSLIRPSDHSTAFGGEEQRIDYLVFWMRSLLEQYEHPLFNEPLISAINLDGQAGWQLIFPGLDRTPLLAAFQVGLKAMLLAHGVHESAGSVKTELVDMIKKKNAELKSHALAGFNMLHFLKEAINLGIPWFKYSSDIFQLGYGANSRLLRSSITDRTANISVGIARDKQKTNQLLRSAGLPVPVQAVVASAEAAVKAGKTMGYPVVVKPADRDGGLGVDACLQDDESVRLAFKQASEFSKNIVVEKYIEGNDYRILVVNDQVLGVLERAPGGVTGDGNRTVRELVKSQNQERAQATDDRRFLHPIKIDHEAKRMLLQAGLAWEDVPSKDRFVRLRAAANVASGGIPREIPIAEIHPDNVMLAQRIARVLRLDVAGIDLLMPDIRKSWLECGAGVCEVNAQPQMFTTLHAPLLRAIMPEMPGRIPVVVVLTMSDNGEFSEQLYQRILGACPNAGYVSRRKALLAGRRAALPEASQFNLSRSLLLDTSLEALLISVSDGELLSSGWPVDRCDVLLFAGAQQPDAVGMSPDILMKIAQSAKTLQPSKILVDRDDKDCVEVAFQIEWIGENMAGGACERQLNSRTEMPERLFQCLAFSRPAIDHLTHSDVAIRTHQSEVSP